MISPEMWIQQWRPRAASEWRRPGAEFGTAAVGRRVAELLAALRQGGGDALLRIEAALRADHSVAVAAALNAVALAPADLEVEVRAGAVPADLMQALVTARARLRDFAGAAMPRTVSHTDTMGNVAELRVVPLDRVGIYVPGGRAPYVSSVLMAAVPARAAGVKDVVLCTPARPDGTPDPGILTAAAVAGVDRLFLLGAVQALAAMAWGLGPVPRCDKVVGPGGPYVVEAKRQLFGEAGLDGLPGPSEIVVLASEGADPAWVAADLLAQAEHGPDSLAILISTELRLAEDVALRLIEQAERLPERRREDALTSLLASGGPIVVATPEAGLVLAEEIAPEHLSLQGAAAEALSDRVGKAGAVFVGPWSPVAAGDYAAGTNHVLPTAGTARFASGLTPADFVRRMEVFRGLADGAVAWAPPAETLARAEGFIAHAESIALRRRAAGAPRGPEPAAPYVPPVPAHAVRLDLNENPFPWPDDLWAEVLPALRAAEPTRYPRDTDRLQAALAAYAGVPVDQCLPGNGSDELLLAAAAAWGSRVSRALFPTPTFGMYRRLARAAGVPAVGIPVGPAPDFALPVDALLAEIRKGGDTLLFLCRPNNPTGTLWPANQVRRLVETEGVWAVVDEAYIEFAGEDLSDWLPTHPRLCLLRTMSKAFALAGLRVGYALGRPDALADLRQAVQPWAISTFSCASAMAALGRPEGMRQQVRELISERARLTAELGRLPGVTPYPSRANYVLFGVDAATAGWDAFALFDHLYAAGAVLRRWKDEPALRHCLRVSVGRPEENDRLLELLAAAVSGRRG